MCDHQALTSMERYFEIHTNICIWYSKSTAKPPTNQKQIYSATRLVSFFAQLAALVRFATIWLGVLAINAPLHFNSNVKRRRQSIKRTRRLRCRRRSRSRRQLSNA